MKFDYSKIKLGILRALKISVFFKKKRGTFPFNRLPLIVRNQVIQSLGHKDCMNLAMTSKKAGETVRMANLKPPIAVIDISPAAHIRLWRRELVLFPNQICKQVEKAEVMKSKELKRWTDQPSKSIVENTAKLYRKIEHLFRFKDQFVLVFSADYKKVTTVDEVLSDSTMRNWGYCNFKGETIDSEEMKLILDLASPDRSFTSYAKECPIDFKHEKALNFRNCSYEDARWVKIEDLYGLNNCQHICLGRTNFTQTQIKQFIGYWVNSDIDMFWWMEIRTHENFDLVEMLDGLIILHIDNCNRTFFTMTKSSETRKKTLLCFFNIGDILQLSAWAPGEFDSGTGEHEFDRTIRSKERVFDLLVEKKQLEVGREVADERKQTIISTKLEQVNDELEGCGVFFVDGKAILRMPKL